MDKKYYNEITKEIFIPEDEPQLFEDGLGCLMYERLKLYGNNTIQINSENGEEDKASSVLQRSVRTALEMKSRGIKENDVISVCSHNHFDAIVPIIAATFIGAVPASLDPSFSEDDITYLVNLVKPKMIFASQDGLSKIEAIKNNLDCNPEVILFAGGAKLNSFENFLKRNKNEDTFLPIKRSLDELAVIFFSSGTTGNPKGISTPARTVIYHCDKMQAPGAALIYTTLYWIGSYICSMLSLLHGTPKVLCQNFDPATAWGIYDKFKVGILLINPYKVSSLIQYKPENELVNLKFIAIVGSSVCKEHLMDLKNLVPNTVVTSAYAQTETWGSFSNRIAMGMGKHESIGVPVPERIFKIVDIETEEALGYNKPGELRIKSKYMSSGYYNHDSADNGLDENGFFKTGDVLYYDEDFCFYVVDRIKEMFKYRGWHVVPAKIENVIKKHPGVLDAVVVGIPHIIEENLSLAIVIPKSDHQLILNDIEDFANNLLDDVHKIRAGVKIVKEFPQTPSGKILRRKLKDMFLANEL